MEKYCLLCAVGTEFLNIIQISSGFRGLIKTMNNNFKRKELKFVLHNVPIQEK
jgi:hypothetical protein